MKYKPSDLGMRTPCDMIAWVWIDSRLKEELMEWLALFVGLISYPFVWVIQMALKND